MTSPDADPRAAAAEFYDLEPDFPDDLDFYRRAIPHPRARLLELGCGTGRVLTALVDSCGYIHGIDSSPAMLGICSRKLREAGVDRERAGMSLGDIAEFDLGRRFDLILAPYRVFQNLESDARIERMFRRVRDHLTASGTFILDAFNPNRDRESLRREWSDDSERFCWEVRRDDLTIRCHERRSRIDHEPLVLHPVLIYRVHRGGRLERQVEFEFPMRCHYPEELVERVERHGFRVVNRWGGYAGEHYGSGPELLLQIAPADDADDETVTAGERR